MVVMGGHPFPYRNRNNLKVWESDKGQLLNIDLIWAGQDLYGKKTSPSNSSCISVLMAEILRGVRLRVKSFSCLIPASDTKKLYESIVLQ